MTHKMMIRAAVICCLVIHQALSAPFLLNGTYWHNWGDKHGVSHLTRCYFKNYTWFTPAHQPQAAGFYLDVFGPAQNVQLTNSPPGWAWTWHPNAIPQICIGMRGTYLAQATDNTEVFLKPGDVYFGNDQNSAGHQSYTYGNESLLLMCMQFPHMSTTEYRPCWLE